MQKYIVKWYSKSRPETKGQGQPVVKDVALTAVSEMNGKYKDIHHFIEPV
jgi:hypothetical protein